MSTQGKRETASRILLESRLRYHLCCLREDATDPELTSLERLALIPRSRTTDGRDPRDPQGPAGSRAKAPVSPRPPLPPERDPVKILSEDKLRAAIPLGNALRNSPPCVPAIGHLRMPRRANSHQFVRYRGPRIADAIQGPGLSLGEAIMIASTAHFGVARPA